MADVVRFLLDGKIREIAGVHPTQSLLAYLRYDLQKTGTKEGCAEGDCGACTVLIGELKDDRIEYKAVNACIIFLATLHGKELVTVESLTADGGQLHPVQQSLVDHHGSQCGFCTPGIVMSLYALYLTTRDQARDQARDQESASLDQINDCLAGNLCRCTGYGPIITAAQKMYSYPEPAPAMAMGEKVALLKSMQEDTVFSLMTEGQSRYIAPISLDDLAQAILDHPDAVILAGGTDVGLWVTKQHRDLGAVIYLGNVTTLKQINEQNDTLHIGAGVTYTAAMDQIAQHYPDFGEIIRRLGATQVRNQGTLGGNIANGSPIGDSPPCLIALGAQLVLRRGDASRTINLEDYFIAYGDQDLKAGEFVEKIILPLPQKNQNFKAYKISKRFDQDISALCMAMSYKVDGDQFTSVRIAYGGMAATPLRARACEAILEGKAWDQNLISQAMAALEQDFTPLSDMRASDSYRMQVAKNLILKVFLETQQDSAPTRILNNREQAHG